MAVRCRLTRIPPQIYEAVKMNETFEPSNEIVGDEYDWHEFQIVSIDATWWDFHRAFKEEGKPLQYAIQGDYAPQGGLELYSQGEGDDSYLAYVSPLMAQQISQVLSQFDFDSIAMKVDPSGELIDSYFSPYFEDLSEFYRETSLEGFAVFIIVT